MQHFLKMQKIFLLPEYIKLISRGVFLCVFAFGSTGIEKVNETGLK